MSHSMLSNWADQRSYRWTAIAFIVSIIVLGAYGWRLSIDELAVMQAVEDDRLDAIQQAEQEHKLQARLKELCGGPNATVVPRAHGGYDCYATNGRKTKTIQGVK